MPESSVTISGIRKYLFSQLKVDPQRAWGQAFAWPAKQTTNTGSENPEKMSDATVAVTQAFFARLKPLTISKLVIVVDANRQALYQGLDTHDPERTRFIQLARTAGARVVDTESLFKAHLATSPLKLDVGPGDAHLNAMGVNLVMHAAALELGRP